MQTSQTLQQHKTTANVFGNTKLLFLFVASASVYMYHCIQKTQPLLQLVCKPMPILILIYMLVAHQVAKPSSKHSTFVIGFSVLILLGLICSAVGDVLLLFHDIFVTHREYEVGKTAMLIRSSFPMWRGKKARQSINFLYYLQDHIPGMIPGYNFIANELLFGQCLTELNATHSVTAMTNEWNERYLVKTLHAAKENSSLIDYIASSIYRHHILFLAGLFAFLAAQIFYFVAFSLQPKPKQNCTTTISVSIYSARFMLQHIKEYVPFGYAMALLYGKYLYPKICDSVLKLPVAVYIGMLTLVCWCCAIRLKQAHNNKASNKPMYSRLRLLGACLFMLSDSLIAVTSFGVLHLSRFAGTLSILCTYYVAQYLLTMSVIEFDQKL